MNGVNFPENMEDLVEVWRQEDKKEIECIIHYIRYFSKRLDRYAFNSDMRKSLVSIIESLKKLKKVLVERYYQNYGRPEVVGRK